MKTGGGADVPENKLAKLRSRVHFAKIHFRGICISKCMSKFNAKNTNVIKYLKYRHVVTQKIPLSIQLEKIDGKNGNVETQR